MFLTHLINELDPTTVAVHEPFPARFELMLGNLSNDVGFGRSLVQWLFFTTRRRRISSLGSRRPYIEINPLLCPIIDILPALGHPLKVIHVVREPLSWARSIGAFKASEGVRPFFAMIPFAIPYPHPRPKGWRQFSQLERDLWRWRFCNENILANKASYQSYTLIRYEDLFGDDEVRRIALNKLMAALPLSSPEMPSNAAFSGAINKAPKTKQSNNIDPCIVRAICGDLMDAFEYE